MATITASVGAAAANKEQDVRLVQRLLNEHDLAPLLPVAEDGRMTAACIEAIRHFQARHVNMPSPDGRVDPGGRTIARLLTRQPSRGTSSSAETRRADRSMRAAIVDGRVKENAVTTRIIDRIVPDLSRIRARVISGYLNDSDLFWKVNYHWEYLLEAVAHASTLEVSDDTKRALATIQSQLRSCSPDPPSGYTTSALGKPEDRSLPEDARRRHSILSQAKAEFRRIVVAAKLKEKSKKNPHVLDLAGAPVARPGTSKHATGYALDIAGDNGAIKAACRGLGATLVFDEQSHVHVEFANG